MKKLTNHTIFVVSILTAYLLKDLVFKMLGKVEKFQSDKYLSVLIHMVVIVIIFYPIYFLLAKLGEYVADSVIRKSQKMTGSAFIGWFLGFVVLTSILYCGYAWVMYKITVVDIVQKIF